MHTPLALGFFILSLIATALTPLAAVAQPLMRQTRDIRMVGGSSLPGMLAVTLVRDRSRSIRYLDLAQGRVLEFPSPVANAGNPSFSPDGLSVAFAGSTRRGNEIFTSDWSGSNFARITFNGIDDGNPSFNAEGDAVIYFSETRRYKSEIFSILRDSPYSRSQLTAVGGGNTTPSESPDGRYLLYTTDRYRPAWNICLVDTVSQRETCPLRGGNSSNCRAHWSPDGSQFVFTRERGHSVDLYLYTIATRVSERLTELPHKEYDAVWSPDGRYIAFAHDPKGTLSYEIKAVRLSDKRVFPIARAEHGSLRYLSWSVARPYSVAGDLCPKDPNKTRPGQCGCGRSERDTDEDTLADCLDGCPRNPRKHRGRTCD